MAEYVGGAVARRYVHGPEVDEPLLWYEGSGVADRRWLIADRQGSIIAATNASGGLVGSIQRYGPFGEPNAWAGSRFRYTGQIALPELRLYHYKARVYDPGLGRFLQTDPIGYEDDLNLYAYVRNDPLNATDPTGLECFSIGSSYKCIALPAAGSLGQGVTRDELGAVSTAAAETMARLMENPDRPVEISVGDTTAVTTQGAIADRLAGADLRVSNEQNTGVDARAEAAVISPDGSGRITVTRDGAAQSRSDLRVTMTHEPMHLDPEVRDAFGPEMSDPDWNENHQSGFDRAARRVWHD